MSAAYVRPRSKPTVIGVHHHSLGGDYAHTVTPLEELALLEESCRRGDLKSHKRHQAVPRLGRAAIRPHRGVALRKRMRRRREHLRKRKRRKREGEESLPDLGLDVCATSSLRWLEKRRRAGGAAVRPQFPLTRLQEGGAH
jgi:hypothetical protein